MRLGFLFRLRALALVQVIDVMMFRAALDGLLHLDGDVLDAEVLRRNLAQAAEQRIELLECVFAVSAADASITVAEESEARRISQELGLDHTEFVRARAAYVEHLEALRAFRRQRTGAPPDVSGAAES